MKQSDQDAVQLWQEQLADKLRRGSAKEIKSELRQGLYHVVASFPLSDGKESWESCAKYSKHDRAEDAVRAIKRLAALHN